MGLATAAGSLGQFVFAPLGQAFLVDYGWQVALLLLAGCMVVVPALAVALKGGGVGRQDMEEPALPPVTRFGRLLGIAATCCSLRDSSFAASTWRS